MHFRLHGAEVASGDKMGVIAVRVLPLRLPAIPVRNVPTAENIDDGAANGREVFGAVIGSPSNTYEIGELGVFGNERVLRCRDAVPVRTVTGLQFAMRNPVN